MGLIIEYESFNRLTLLIERASSSYILSERCFCLANIFRFRLHAFHDCDSSKQMNKYE